MKKERINLIELSATPLGVLIAPMCASFMQTDAASEIFNAHRHDYYSLFLLDRGSITYEVDVQYVKMATGSLLIIRPGQVHRLLSLSDISGWVMSFDSKLIDQLAAAALERESPSISLITLKDEDISFVKDLLNSLWKVTQQTPQVDFQPQLLQALLNAVCYHVVNLCRQSLLVTEPSNSRQAQIAAQFSALVKSHNIKNKRPAGYAAMMNLSVSYLNDVVKAATGYSATYIIQQQVMGEAQRLLRYSTKSVKEIAFVLGYQDHRYFIRLFGKVCGMSPVAYRKTDHKSDYANRGTQFNADQLIIHEK
ncbi:AraC family transcriptional regulator [Mucilaginibacter roseus]|uniref:AraC family transcriptional regulator n=1 Tax=Mucilaginibacter roseus TaxID=1528868 RepID=A0ABS8U4I6_9SPHI|nr:helix-turn-helix transcriptional regulator [Mucilaginibacter roseus]MCD8741020.1 AraC family transcriptional regulator [Mucilaginibacter roseus]